MRIHFCVEDTITPRPPNWDPSTSPKRVSFSLLLCPGPILLQILSIKVDIVGESPYCLQSSGFVLTGRVMEYSTESGGTVVDGLGWLTKTFAGAGTVRTSSGVRGLLGAPYGGGGVSREGSSSVMSVVTGRRETLGCSSTGLAVDSELL